MYKKVGKLWNKKDFHIIEIYDDMYVLNEDGWNGEVYNGCWKVADAKGYETIGNETFTIKPIYKEVDEDDFEIVDYFVCY